jgi:N-acetylmuramoyl-L-alanine amidase
MSKYHYILNNGHGNDTYVKSDKLNPYRMSEIFKDGTQLKEYEVTRNVVKYLSFMLRQDRIDCTTLVPELNDISIRERVRRANLIPNSIYLSIHFDWFIDKRVHGFTTHYKSEKGKKLALVFQKHTGELGRDRGVKQSNFMELRLTNMPAILTENGFYSNEKEAKKLMDNDFQYEIAYQHYKAIKELEIT